MFRHLAAAAGTCLTMAATPALAAVVGPASGVIDGTAAATGWQANPGGIGHINLVPYYAVLGGFDTYLNLTNTDTRNGKAVKLRFRAADNGDTVFDMTVLLSPGDQWAAAITRDGPTGLPRLVHGDKSCTLPADVKQLFNTARLNPSAQISAADRAALAGVGSVELITMADIPPRTGLADPPLFTAIQQINGVAPCTGSALAPLANDPLSYADAQAKGLEVPTTGLMTRWTLINVPRAVSYTGVATALEARSGANGLAGYGNIVLSPQTSVAMGSLASIRSQTTDPLLRGGVPDNLSTTGMDLSTVPARVSARYSDLPDISTPYLPQALTSGLSTGLATRNQIRSLSQALAVSSVANEYVVHPDIKAGTDWVMSLPTLRYNAAFDATGGAAIYTHFAFDDLGVSIPGFGIANDFTPATVQASEARVNVWIRLSMPNLTESERRRESPAYFDTDGRQQIFFEPAAAPPFSGLRLKGNASVVRLVRNGNPVQPVLPTASGPSLLADMPGLSGWVRLHTPLAGNGLPVIGFAAVELFNAAATPGTAGVYGQVFMHSTTRANPPQ